MTEEDPFDAVERRYQDTAERSRISIDTTSRTESEYRAVAEKPPCEELHPTHEGLCPDLIVGEAYDALDPHSEHRVQQDALDDRSFRTCGRGDISNLPTHQERERAARAISRRDPLVDETMAKIIVEGAEEQIARNRRRAITVLTITGLSCGCFVMSLVQTGDPSVALGVSGFMFLLMVLAYKVVGNLWTMGSSSGSAV